MADNGDIRFIQYSNVGIVEHDTILPDGSIRHVRPVFDISVTAEKQSPFSRAAQNETAKELYGMGLFEPERAIPALVCLDMMDFEGKDKIRQQIQENATMLQQFQAAMQIIQQLAMADPRIAQVAMQAGLLDPQQFGQMQQQAQQTQPGQPSKQGTPEERAAQASNLGDHSQAAKARLRAATAAQPR